MKVTITKLRQDLFRLADSALEGEALEFTHKGVVFTVTAAGGRSKLSRLTGQRVLAPKVNLKASRKKLLAGMQVAWEKDWSRL